MLLIQTLRELRTDREFRRKLAALTIPITLQSLMLALVAAAVGAESHGGSLSGNTNPVCAEYDPLRRGQRNRHSGSTVLGKAGHPGPGPDSGQQCPGGVSGFGGVFCGVPVVSGTADETFCLGC